MQLCFLSECADSNFSSPNLNINVPQREQLLIYMKRKEKREAKPTANSVGHSSMSIKD